MINVEADAAAHLSDGKHNNGSTGSSTLILTEHKKPFLLKMAECTPAQKQKRHAFRESLLGIAGAEREVLGEAGTGRDTGGSGLKSGDSLRRGRGRRRKRGRNSKSSGGLADTREV